jgi:hypothetical protein
MLLVIVTRELIFIWCTKDIYSKIENALHKECFEAPPNYDLQAK